VQRACGERVAAVELAVQVTGIGYIGFDVHIDLVADLVIDGGALRRAVLQCQPGMPGYRHRPVAVEAAVRIDRDWQGGQLREFAPALAEEVADWYFYRGLVCAVPIGAQDEGAPIAVVGGQPEMRDECWPVDARQIERGVSADLDAGRDFPARAEVCRAGRAGAVQGSGAAALRPVEVFRADRAGLGAAQSGQRTEVGHKSRRASGRVPSRGWHRARGGPPADRASRPGCRSATR